MVTLTVPYIVEPFFEIVNANQSVPFCYRMKYHMELFGIVPEWVLLGQSMYEVVVLERSLQRRDEVVVMEEIITEEGRGGGDGGDHYRGGTRWW